MKQTNKLTPQIIGATLATAFMQADKVADNAKKDLLLASAETYAGDIKVTKELLDSYGETFIEAGHSKNSAKSRKSEARRVFEAVASTAVSKDNLKKLQDFEGGYHEFIGLARDLAGQVTKASKAASNRIPKITALQEQAIIDKMKSATIIQLSDFVETCSEVLNEPKNKEGAILAEKQQFILLNSIANNMMKNPQYDELTKKSALQIFEITNSQIGRISANEKKVEKAIKEIEATPATQEQATA